MRPKLTYANVMATIAVFIALGGASYAALKLPKNSVGTKQIKKSAVTTAKIKDGAVTGAKVAVSSLGTVPSATHAASADNTTQLGGQPATSYAPAQLEPIHVISEPGQPTFEHGCKNAGPGNAFGQAGFYKDGYGIVHLVGALETCTLTQSAFTLPVGFRPTVNNGTETGPEGAVVVVTKSGEVLVFQSTVPYLFGVTFRTTP